MGIEDWKSITLGDFVTLQRGHDLPEHQRRIGNIPILGSFGITGYHDTAKAKAPGVTVGRSGTSFGIVNYTTVDYWPLNTALYVINFHGNDERFTYYFLQSLDLKRYNSGSAQPSLNRNYIHPLPVKIPPLSEQKAIAHILGTLDDKIELNKQMNETLEAIARTIFKSWFVKFDPVRAKMEGKQPAGMDAATADLFPDEFEESSLGLIPKGWRVKALPEFIEINPKRSLAKGKIAPYLDMKNMPTQGHRPDIWIDRIFVCGTKFINGDTFDKELEQITATADSKTRHADKLFQVWLLDNQEVWVLIHVEVQSQYDKEFSQRMFIYNYRAFDLYQKPVISLAILGDETKNWLPNSYRYGLGSSQLIFNFSTVKLLNYQWEELEQSNNIFAIVVMAHLKTKATNSNLSAREQWKWKLARLLYERGYNRKEIVDLYKVIDLMMALSGDLQLSFEEKLTNYQEKLKMPLLTNIEQRTIEKTRKQTLKQNIIKLLQVRFCDIPENLVNSINQIDDTSFLEQLLTSTISVNSLEEFAQLVNSHLQKSNKGG